MRELKFRGWNGKRMTRAYTLNEMMVEQLEFNGLKENWMQYTGLKDKNGKEIYDGDIVMIEDYYHDYQDGIAISSIPDNRIEAVEWEEKHGLWVVKSDALYEVRPECEVIGNVWENPELLTDK